MTLTAERLREVLAYDPDTGVFVWRVPPVNQVRAGDVAGGIMGAGYLVITIDRKKHYSHRLAWLYVHGAWPIEEIDHIDMLRTNNKLSNLREATVTQNNVNRPVHSNNKSGTKGVRATKNGERWSARIGVSGRTIDLGCYNTKEEAGAAYAEAARRYYGEFARSA